ncbi:NAD(P)-dependent alcohol dehydrogenase [Nonomuraea africana]|uniref:NADPH:quinone reductase-like Zn-dependent oxidoreductase n=1 Tax=Nonomuraea africana TaxID=46171 RepID=A0ABR9KRL5_9ACTN|nr:NAD(P)-dependent alcohol dehydrogenase [Nonomuraea africana]MBE1564664.1 NADPH:quinone reductase-like Zn-dependent oxidoreductase [Nonomuraea africana]
MKAIVQHRYGSPDVLEFTDVDLPAVKDDEVLVRVRAAAVNHADWVMTRGMPYAARLAFGLRRPTTTVRGRDVAGQVEAVGAKVTRFRPGDEVYAETDAGSFAEYTRVPEGLLALKPANLTFEQAAAVPVAAIAALQALRDRGKVRPGQRVLINGASGGVGTFAVQLAKALGAEVTGVCSTRNLDLVRSIGADHVVDYSREDFTTGGRRYDLIVDLAGNRPLSACRRALTPTGTLVLSSGGGGRWFGPLRRIVSALAVSPFVRQSLRPHTATRSKDDLAVLTELIEAGKVTPAIDRTYPLSEAAEALRYFVEEHARAKIVITV